MTTSYSILRRLSVMEVLLGNRSKARKASRYIKKWSEMHKEKISWMLNPSPAVSWGNTTFFYRQENPPRMALMQFPLWTCRGAIPEFITEIRFRFYLAATSRFSSSLNGISLRSITRFIDRVNLNSMPSVSCAKFKTVKWCFFFMTGVICLDVLTSMPSHLCVIWCDGGMNAVITVLYSSKLCSWAFPTLLLYGSGWQKVPFSAITWVSTHQLAIQLSLDVMNSGE